VQSSSQIITTNKPAPSFLQAGCPSCCPTSSIKAVKENEKSNHSKTFIRMGQKQKLVVTSCMSIYSDVLLSIPACTDVCNIKR